MLKIKEAKLLNSSYYTVSCKTEEKEIKRTLFYDEFLFKARKNAIEDFLKIYNSALEFFNYSNSPFYIELEIVSNNKSISGVLFSSIVSEDKLWEKVFGNWYKPTYQDNLIMRFERELQYYYENKLIFFASIDALREPWTDYEFMKNMHEVIYCLPGTKKL